MSPLKALVGDTKTVLLAGEAGIKEALEISEVTTVLAAISGSAGLKPTLQAIKYGKVALANKETLVTAEHIVMENVQEKNVPIITC